MKNELIRIARKAGEFFLERELTEIVSKEGHANYVTNIDCRVQAYLEEALGRLMPGSRFIGEEKENQALGNEPTWIVDPVDGTTNLIHDYRMSAVSAALCENRRPTVGVVFQPYTKELFYAETGGGAIFLRARGGVRTPPRRGWRLDDSATCRLGPSRRVGRSQSRRTGMRAAASRRAHPLRGYRFIFAVRAIRKARMPTRTSVPSRSAIDSRRRTANITA